MLRGSSYLDGEILVDDGGGRCVDGRGEVVLIGAQRLAAQARDVQRHGEVVHAGVCVCEPLSAERERTGDDERVSSSRAGCERRQSSARAPVKNPLTSSRAS